MLATFRSKLNRHLLQYSVACSQVNTEAEALGEAERLVENTLIAQKIVQEVAEKVQLQAHKQIASVVTRCLETVFEEDAYTFRINFEKRRGRTEAVLAFERDGHVLEDPTNESGGGTIDIAALALQLITLVLSRPPRRKFLGIDEGLKFVNGEENQERVGALLLSLAKDFGVQFVLVSDDDWLKVGKVIEL